MSNFTSQSSINQENVDEFVFLKVYISLEIVALALHILLQWVIYKLPVDENQYYLIQMLSIFDSIFSILIICHIGYFISATGRGTLPNQTLMVTLSFLSNVTHASSMFVTTLIVIDRWIAVKYALRYHALVSKRKINITVLISIIFCAFTLSCLFFIGDVRSVSTHKMFFTKGDILSFILVLRSITCVTIIVLGKLTIRLRDTSEANRPHAKNLHGVEAERLDILINLKRNVKDVMKLNIWTCVFLVPMIFCTLILLVSDVSEIGFKLNAVFGLVNVISNPIVYLTCFTRIRQYWLRRWFQRGTVNPDGSK